MTILILLLGILIVAGLDELYHLHNNKCKHDWEFYEKGNVLHGDNVTGAYKAYQCENCLKFKKVEF